jgi:hypothetical protein
MLARDKVSNFENFPLGFGSVAYRDPRHMLVRSRAEGLVENEIDKGMVYVSDSNFGRCLSGVLL